MTERITKTLLRSGKLLHYLIHMAIFAAFCRMFNISTKHDYSIVDIVEATCVTEGTKTYKCACGAVKAEQETIPFL